MVHRCNSNPGCDDLSDEFDCEIIKPAQSYQSYIAPSPAEEDETKVKILVSADIVSILDIDEISSIFQVQFYLHFSWYDPRYNFQRDHFLHLVYVILYQIDLLQSEN